VTPRCLNGKTQACPVLGPDSVVQEGTVRGSVVQLEVADTRQSPQELVTTAPVESVAVAHQGVGEAA